MTYIPANLRREVIERAGNCCEYCLLSQEDVDLSFHIEHIIAEKHGGQTILNNLCLSCSHCNLYKGSDLSSVDWEADEEITPLYNPRRHHWSGHFQLVDSRIEAKTSHGRVTIFLLRFNEAQRIAERLVLIRLNRYPCQPI
jgi:hypothetical protein